MIFSEEIKMKKLTVLCLLSVAISGCATQSFNLTSGRVDEIPDEETSQHFFVGGIAQMKSMNAASICGGSSRVARVEARSSPLDAVLSMLTMGIYTPRTARVYCSQ
ncbi:MAG: Bor family protein [Kistimonas sp.]|nr:Bor family protein [Kistimonas sp.]